MDWVKVSERYPLHGQIVAVKMVDENKNLMYGIGYWDAPEKRWHITAKPEEREGPVYQWIELP